MALYFYIVDVSISAVVVETMDVFVVLLNVDL